MQQKTKHPLHLARIISVPHHFQKNNFRLYLSKNQVMDNTFRIFKPKNTVFRFTKGWILFVLLVISVSLTDYYDTKIIRIISVVVLVICLLFHITKSMRYTYLDGTFEGELIFGTDYIKINNRKIHLQDIAKIHIRANDYEGLLTSATHSYQQNMSNGTNNLLDLTLTNKERIKVFFQMDYISDIKFMTPILRELIAIHFIPFEEDNEIAAVNDYFKYKKAD